MKITIPLKNIYHVQFKESKKLALTFCRIQEFYESPNKKLNNKYFSLETFLYESMNKECELDYFNKWGGYNIPSDVFFKFSEIFGHDLYENEYKFIEKITKRIKTRKSYNEKFYIIGTLEKRGEKQTVEHEIAHALYYLNDDYKKEVDNLVNSLPKKEFNFLKNKLINIGYCDKVIYDEINAYLSTSCEIDLKGVFTKPLKNIKIPFVTLYKNYRK